MCVCVCVCVCVKELAHAVMEAVKPQDQQRGPTSWPPWRANCLVAILVKKALRNRRADGIVPAHWPAGSRSRKSQMFHFKSKGRKNYLTQGGSYF